MVTIQSPIEQVQTQTEQLSREVRNLMQKHSETEQLLLAMAEKMGIHMDPKRQPHH